MYTLHAFLEWPLSVDLVLFYVWICLVFLTAKQAQLPTGNAHCRYCLCVYVQQWSQSLYNMSHSQGAVLIQLSESEINVMLKLHVRLCQTLTYLEFEHVLKLHRCQNCIRIAYMYTLMKECLRSKSISDSKSFIRTTQVLLTQRIPF